MDENMMSKIQEVLSDPESMQQIAELAQMFQHGTPNSIPEEQETSAAGTLPAVSSPEMPPFDMGMLMKMGELMKNTGNDKNTALLLALRPHFGERRQQRIDKAIRLMKLWAVFQTMQKTGMLQQLF